MGHSVFPRRVAAPPGIVDGLLKLGAWRTLRNTKNERPLDVARRRGHGDLVGVLEPVLRRELPTLSSPGQQSVRVS